MASKPLRPCKHPGCSELTRDGYCAKHKPKHQRKASADYHSWYGKTIWKRKLRPSQLIHEPWCAECDKQGMRTKATVVDHVRPHRGDWTLFTDETNLQSLCKYHHDKKTALEQAQERSKNGAFF